MDRLIVAYFTLIGVTSAEQYFDSSININARKLATYASFYNGADGYRDPEEPLSKNELVALIIGSIVFFGLVLYAIVEICIDASKRKSQYDMQLKEALQKLKQLGVTDQEITEMRKKFNQLEELGKEAFEQE